MPERRGGASRFSLFGLLGCAASLIVFPHPGRLSIHHVVETSHSLFDPISTVPALGAATVDRNRAWRSRVSLWSGAVAKNPSDARAQYNLGRVLVWEG